MEKSSLTALARQQLTIARQASSGRSAQTVYGGPEHMLRQTLIALAAGHRPDEHDNPGETTVHVLHGGVRLSAGDVGWEGFPGFSSSCPPLGAPSKASKTPRYCSPWPCTADPGWRAAQASLTWTACYVEIPTSVTQHRPVAGSSLASTPGCPSSSHIAVMR